MLINRERSEPIHIPIVTIGNLPSTSRASSDHAPLSLERCAKDMLPTVAHDQPGLLQFGHSTGDGVGVGDGGGGGGGAGGCGARELSTIANDSGSAVNSAPLSGSVFAVSGDGHGNLFGSDGNGALPPTSNRLYM